MRYCSLACAHVIAIASKTHSAMQHSDSKCSVGFKQIINGQFSVNEKIKKINSGLDFKRISRMFFRARKYCDIGYLL